MTQHRAALVAFLTAICVLASSADAASLFSSNATWRLFKGRTEASSPDNTSWRSNSFDDVTFSNSPAPFWYDTTGDTSTRAGGTQLSDMINSYSCIFLRKQFVISNVALVTALQLNANVDDGFVAWINGTEVQRVNMPGVTGDPVTIGTFANGATEPVPFVLYNLSAPTNYLVNGTNTIAIQVFNTTLGSSDLDFDCTLSAILIDTNPPTIVGVTPVPGSVMTSLTQITVQFSEPVTGLSADDLNVHGIGATGLSVNGAGDTFTFTFPPAPYGNVPITWVSGHGITDLAVPPNAFDDSKPGATWSYTLVDDLPPMVSALFPPAGSTVQSLGQIQVNFSEPVSGVDAGDLLINGQPATNMITQPGAVYVFQFPSAPNGLVSVAWKSGHGITDVSTNSFAGGSWNYTVDPNANFNGVVINEVNAANESGLTDEDGEQEDWIELFNGGTNTVNLAGWSLSDSEEEPGQWVFPARSLAPGQYLVVFASAKDRKNPTGTNLFHTNFKLSTDGEFLGLFTPDSPRRLASGFSPKLPKQRNDNSYGFDPNGQLRYFATPTPGASNGFSSIVGVTERVHFSTTRGHFTQPFNLVLSCETRGSTIRYTTNGTEPTLVNGLTYGGPITVNNTFLIRAAAFRTNYLPSGVDSHSYFYNQSAAIRSLPIVSIQTASNNMTGPTGIIGMQGGTGPPNNPWTPILPTDYYNPTKTGIAWERPMSVEWILPTDNSGFQIDCGMRVHGSDYTRPRYEATSKFSYRLYFRGDYGSGRLDYSLFPECVVQNFDIITLRAGHNDISNPFLRDELVRRLEADMGQVAVHGTWANFFLNGVYKGYYNPCERVEEGFLQSWHGGSNSWDIITVGSAVQGGDNIAWNSMRTYVSGQDPTQPAVFSEIMRRLDVVNFIDYLIVNVYGANWDWPHNNWRAAKERSASGIFRFYIWDAEGAFGLTGRAANSFDSFSTTDSGLLTSGAEIPVLYQRLRLSPEFRLMWADRVQKHFFNNGAMTDLNISNRFNQMRSALLGVIPSFDNSIVTTWIPQRRPVLFGQFDLYGLMASSNAPVFNQHGGTVPPGFNLTMVAPTIGGTIYYTTNGADPRIMFTGAISNSAIAYTGSIVLNQSTLVRARTLNGGNWSALTEANFAVATRGVPLRIVEINYNPSGSTAYEFIELQNIGTAPVDLSGMNFEGVTYTFPAFSTLPAGARLVLVSDFDPNAFAAHYPGVTVRGYYSGSLNNGGERIALKDAAGNIITSLDYDDAGGWPVAADGGGYSLEIVNPFGDPDDPANWRASSTPGGTPGTGSSTPPLGNVRLNEVLADNLSAVSNGGTYPDFVELANISGAPVSLDGWSITDDGNARKFVLPPGTTIGANGFLVVWCDAATNTTPGLHSDFSFGRNGDNVFLYDANTNLADALTFGLQLPNYSVGRVGSDWVLTTPTTNAANIAASVGAASSLSINEFLANALPNQPDWIELYCNSSLPVGLRGTFISNTSTVHQITSLSFIAPYGFVQLFADEGVGPDHIDFKLPAAGGTIVLYDTLANEVNRVTYSAQGEGISRGRLPDGSLNIVNFPGTASPGASNYTATYNGPILNEVLARNVSAVTNSSGRVADFVELYNPSLSPFSLAGMSLSVNSLEPSQWIFPPGASIGGQSYLVIWCDDGQPVSTNAPNYNTGRALDGESGGAYLFNTSGQLVNSVEYGFQVTDRSIGLSGGVWRLLASPTPGVVNGSVSALGTNTALRINEWMANPASGPDWFELFNSTNQPVDLAGLVLTDDPTTSGTNEFHIAPLSFIGAGGFVQLIADSQPEQGRNHVNFDLDSLGESIRIYASNGSNIIDTVAFGAQAFGVSQGRIPDGGNLIFGFPGSPTPAEPNYRLTTEVAINELLTFANSPLEDMIELVNFTGGAADISGWFLSDNALVPKKFRIPNGTTIPANGFAVFSESQFNTGPNAFSLDRALGGELWLSAADTATNLTGFRTRAKFGASSADVSFGRYTGSEGTEFVAQTARTFGAVNNAPLVGPVIINEIMYHPPDGIGGATEFIELRNITNAPIDLFDPARPTNCWRLSDGIDFTFPQGTTLAANGYLLVVDFDPVANPITLNAFRAYYGVSPSIPVFGPYTGKLDNGGETIDLFKPDLPLGTFVPYVRVDKVSYHDSAPWPESADGTGFSLQRRSSTTYGNDAANWLAASPTAGSANAAGGIAPPVIVQSPANTNVLINSDLLLQAAATGTGPLSWQWRFNGSPLPGQTNSSLLVNFMQNGDAGAYDVFVSNPGGSAFSSIAQVGVAEPPTILSAPLGVVGTNAGSNVTFTVVANGTAPLIYQWRLNGSDISGANTPTLLLTNLVLGQSGIYGLAISNLYGGTSTNILLQVLIRPVITNHIQPQTVLQGGTAIFTVTAGPDNPFVPLGYRWIRNGSGVATTSVPILVITNVQVSANYRVAVTNAAAPAGVLSPTTGQVPLTMIPDGDADGMADSWEIAYFGSTNAAPNLDADGDGMSNRDEYLAGTDPTNALSVLKILLTTTNANMLTFVAQTNIGYSVQWRSNLATGGWSNLTSITAQSQVRTIQVDAASAPPSLQRYYRIITPLVP
jgi:hypothetical protein